MDSGNTVAIRTAITTNELHLLQLHQARELLIGPKWEEVDVFGDRNWDKLTKNTTSVYDVNQQHLTEAEAFGIQSLLDLGAKRRAHF